MLSGYINLNKYVFLVCLQHLMKKYKSILLFLSRNLQAYLYVLRKDINGQRNLLLRLGSVKTDESE